MNKRKRTTLRMGENIANEAIDKGLISKIYKKLMHLTIKKTNNNQKMGKRSKQTFTQRRHAIAKNHMKRCLTSLIIIEAQIKTTVRYYLASVTISSAQFSHSVMSDSLQPHESQHARPPCPSPTHGVYPNPCPSSQ